MIGGLIRLAVAVSGSGSGAIDFPGLGLRFVVFVRVPCSDGSSGGSRVGVSVGTLNFFMLTTCTTSVLSEDLRGFLTS